MRTEFLQCLVFMATFCGGLAVAGLSLVLPCYFLGMWGLPVSFVLFVLVLTTMIYVFDY